MPQSHWDSEVALSRYEMNFEDRAVVWVSAV